MPDTTQNLALPLIAAGQAQKHVTHNEALVQLDALVQLACRDKDLAAPPANPAEGDRYLVAAANPTGAWAGLSGQVACLRDGVWVGLAPRPGWFAYVADEAELYLFTGAAWVSFRTTIATPQTLARLGINTGADAGNRLAVKSDAALFSFDDVTPGSGDMRITLNRKASGNDAGFTFQTGYSTRALFGTLADDDCVIKVSADGASYREGMRIKAASGLATFPSGVQIPNRRTFTAVHKITAQTLTGAFTRITLGGIDEDTGGNWDAAGNWYVCPRSGVYLMTATIRVADGTPAGSDYSCGIYTAEVDGPWHLWTVVTGAYRNTFAYSRLGFQNAGDKLRMFAFSGSGAVIQAAGLQIALVSDAV